MQNEYRERQLELEKLKLQEELKNKDYSSSIEELKKRLEYFESKLEEQSKKEPTIINNVEGEKIECLSFNLKDDTLRLKTSLKELSTPIPIRVNEYTKVVEKTESNKNENSIVEKRTTNSTHEKESAQEQKVIDTEPKKYYADVTIVLNPRKGKLGNYARLGYLYSPSSARDPDATVEIFDTVDGRRVLVGNAYPFSSQEHNVVIKSSCGKKIVGYAKNKVY